VTNKSRVSEAPRLIAEGYGDRRLANELGITRWAARQLIQETKLAEIASTALTVPAGGGGILARYDAACLALAAAVSANEVMTIRLEAKAIEAVARVAKNFDLEVQAVKLRTRAEAKLGEMLEQGERDGIIAARGGYRRNEGSESEPSSAPAKLSEIGIDKKLSARARKLSGIGAQAVAVMLDRMEAESRQRGRLAVNVIDAEIGKRNTASRRHLARELSEKSAELSSTGRKFPCLYADPAYRRKAGIGNRAYENHFTTMTWADILAMPVADRLLPDAWGFVWIPRAHLLALVDTEIETPLGPCRMKIPLAWAIQIKWGFDSYSTCCVWTKTDDECPEDHGTGLVFFDQDELLLVFRRGRGLPKPDTEKKYGSNHRERAGDHSAKPPFYREMINDMTGGLPVLELFAREDDTHQLPENFFTWGNQSHNTAETIDPETGEIIEPTAETEAA
jgi:N6-adenosine-specific RNA methylase IME4